MKNKQRTPPYKMSPWDYAKWCKRQDRRDEFRLVAKHAKNPELPIPEGYHPARFRGMIKYYLQGGYDFNFDVGSDD